MTTFDHPAKPAGPSGLPGPADHAMLRAAFGAPELAWLRERVRRRMQLGGQLSGVVTLPDPTPAQREAVARLLGRRTGTGALRVALPSVSQALSRAGLAADVGAAVVALDGPVADLAEARAAEREAWKAVAARLRAAAEGRPGLDPWVERLERAGIRRLAPTPDEAYDLVEAALAVVGRLPAASVRLARLAAEALGDAHALDAKQPVGRLVFGAAQALFGESTLPDAEGRREVWAATGVLVDDLTTQVLALGLPGGGSSPMDRFLAAARDAGEPAVLTLGMLTRNPPVLPTLAGARVFVCENVTVLAEAADRLGPGCAPLICGSGQPTVAVLRLLDLVTAAGATLAYHGDFDWYGVRIANHLLRRLPIAPWRFRGADYEAAVAAAVPGGAPLSGTPVEPSWDPSLGQAMRTRGVKVEEEVVLDDLLTDLGG
jgi:uncharacterized protein (TIGR02679 family)